MRARHLRAAPGVLLALFWFCVAARAAELPRAAPEDVGLSSERLQRVGAMLQAAVHDQAIPGAVLLVARHGKVAWLQSVGERDPATKAPMTDDTIFRIYSMSKPITVVAALMLEEEGKFTFGDPIAKFMPQFADVKVGVARPNPAGGDAPVLQTVPADRPITVQDLMRHSSGLTYGFFGDTLVKKAYQEAHLFAGDFTNAEFVDRVAKLPLAYQPGTTWDYGVSIDVLGRLVEVASGETLYRFERENLLDPLGMADTAFNAADAVKQGRIAEPFANDRSIGGGIEFFDPRIAGRWESGGGGMLGTAMDYARFLQMLLNGGELEGRRYLSPRTVAYMTADQLGTGVHPGPYYLPGPGHGFGLGVAVRIDAGVATYPGSVGDWWWGGAGGTYFWVDPHLDMLVVYMMQSPKQRVRMRSVLRDMVYAAVMQ
ncbi:MAG: beta-lactamase family protein [Alphaproteobacteria bacterium]|nr:beta-lactamase family protein [Alphaproteobacteria bacterium]